MLHLGLGKELLIFYSCILTSYYYGLTVCDSSKTTVWPGKSPSKRLYLDKSPRRLFCPFIAPLSTSNILLLRLSSKP